MPLPVAWRVWPRYLETPCASVSCRLWSTLFTPTRWYLVVLCRYLWLQTIFCCCVCSIWNLKIWKRPLQAFQEDLVIHWSIYCIYTYWQIYLSAVLEFITADCTLKFLRQQRLCLYELTGNGILLNALKSFIWETCMSTEGSNASCISFVGLVI